MSLGIVSDSDFDAELTKVTDSKATIIDSARLGRTEGSREVPDSLRKIIGENAIEEGSKATKVLTQALGISDSSLSAYKNGTTSTTNYHEPKKELNSYLSKVRKRVTKKASSVLNDALDGITGEKLEATKARDLAGIAKDMSSIIRNLEPEISRGDTNLQNNIILYAPQSVTEEKFDVIHVSE